MTPKFVMTPKFSKITIHRSNKKICTLNDLEVERLQYSHDIHRTLFNGNFSSPVAELLKKGAKVLDFRCGPGTWTCEMSSDFRNSKFYAIESVPCFPTLKPFNVEFIKSDKLDYEIPFEDNTFDFIYAHSARLWYTDTQWKEIIIPELIRILKPGGYLEFMEAEMQLFGEGPETPIMTQYAEKFRALLRSHKINPYMVSELPSILKANQMVEIQKDMRKCPASIWNTKLGEWGARLFTSLILQTLINSKLIKERNRDRIINKMVIEANRVDSYFCDYRIWAKKSNQ